MTGFPWSAEATETAKQLAADGKSASQIASAMRQERPLITRNAVIGRLNRLGLRGGGHTPNKDLANKPRSVRPHSYRLRINLATLAGKAPKLVVRIRSKKHARLIEQRHVAAESKWVTLLDLTNSGCKWPQGDPADLDTFRYCGAWVETDRPYCPHHCGIAYVGTSSQQYAKKLRLRAAAA